MTFDPARHHRRSIRLKGFDYSQAGAYFLTICTHKRYRLFGRVVNGVMRLNEAGRMVQSIWDDIPAFYPGVDTDEFVVMPDHVHGIIVLVGPARGPAPTVPTLSVGDVVQRFKTMTTKRYVDGVKQSGWPPFPGRVWQRDYYERIVRDEIALHCIRRYIRRNPAVTARGT